MKLLVIYFLALEQTIRWWKLQAVIRFLYLDVEITVAGFQSDK